MSMEHSARRGAGERGLAGVALAMLAGGAVAAPVHYEHVESPAGDGNTVILGPVERPSVDENETASMSLRAANQNVGDLGIYNSGGDVSIVVNGGAVSIGTNPAGVELFAEWTESALSETRRRVRAVWQTADGSALLPFGTEINGQPVQFLRWNLGVSDLIHWADDVIGIELISARFFGSFDGGATFSDVESIQALFDNGVSQWTIDGAFDVGDNLITDTSGPAGYNYVMTEYEYEVEFDPIPSPATVTVLAGAGLCLGRRRRK